MPANIGDEPEPVEAERDEFKSRAARRQLEKRLAVTDEGDRQRWRGRRRWRRPDRAPAELVHESTPGGMTGGSNHRFVAGSVIKVSQKSRSRRRKSSRRTPGPITPGADWFKESRQRSLTTTTAAAYGSRPSPGR